MWCANIQQNEAALADAWMALIAKTGAIGDKACSVIFDHVTKIIQAFLGGEDGTDTKASFAALNEERQRGNAFVNHIMCTADGILAKALVESRTRGRVEKQDARASDLLPKLQEMADELGGRNRIASGLPGTPCQEQADNGRVGRRVREGAK